MYTGFKSALLAFSNVSVSGPWPAMQLCRLAPPAIKPFRFGVVLAVDQPHEFVHEIAMEPRRTERVLGDHPARRENHEIKIGSAGNLRRRSQHRVDRRIGMVEAHGIDAIEIREIVFVRDVITVPRNHIQRRVIDLRLPQTALKLARNAAVAFATFKRRNWGEKVARICQSIRANRPEIGQP